MRKITTKLLSCGMATLMIFQNIAWADNSRCDRSCLAPVSVYKSQDNEKTWKEISSVSMSEKEAPKVLEILGGAVFQIAHEATKDKNAIKGLTLLYQYSSGEEKKIYRTKIIEKIDANTNTVDIGDVCDFLRLLAGEAGNNEQLKGEAVRLCKAMMQSLTERYNIASKEDYGTDPTTGKRGRIISQRSGYYKGNFSKWLPEILQLVSDCQILRDNGDLENCMVSKKEDGFLPKIRGIIDNVKMDFDSYDFTYLSAILYQKLKPFTGKDTFVALVAEKIIAKFDKNAASESGEFNINDFYYVECADGVWGYPKNGGVYGFYSLVLEDSRIAPQRMKLCTGYAGVPHVSSPELGRRYNAGEIARLCDVFHPIAQGEFRTNKDSAVKKLETVMQGEIGYSEGAYLNESYPNLPIAIVEDIFKNIEGNTQEAKTALSNYEKYFNDKLKAANEILKLLAEGKSDEARTTAEKELKLFGNLTAQEFEQAVTKAKSVFEKALNLALMPRVALMEKESDPASMLTEFEELINKRDSCAGAEWMAKAVRRMAKSDNPELKKKSAELLGRFADKANTKELSSFVFELVLAINENEHMDNDKKDELLNDIITRFMNEYKNLYAMGQLLLQTATRWDDFKEILRIALKPKYTNTRENTISNLSSLSKKSRTDNAATFEGGVTAKLSRVIAEAVLEGEPKILSETARTALKVYFRAKNDMSSLVSIRKMHPFDKGDVGELSDDGTTLKYIEKIEQLKEMKPDDEKNFYDNSLTDEFQEAKGELEQIIQSEEMPSERRKEQINKIKEYMEELFAWEMEYLLGKYDSKLLAEKGDLGGIKGAVITFKTAKGNAASESQLKNTLLGCIGNSSSSPVLNEIYWDILCGDTLSGDEFSVVNRLKAPIVKDILTEELESRTPSMTPEHLARCFEAFLRGLSLRNSWILKSADYLVYKYNNEVKYWPAERQAQFFKRVLMLHSERLYEEHELPKVHFLAYLFDYLPEKEIDSLINNYKTAVADNDSFVAEAQASAEEVFAKCPLLFTALGNRNRFFNDFLARIIGQFEFTEGECNDEGGLIGVVRQTYSKIEFGDDKHGDLYILNGHILPNIPLCNAMISDIQEAQINPEMTRLINETSSYRVTNAVIGMSDHEQQYKIMRLNRLLLAVRFPGECPSAPEGDLIAYDSKYRYYVDFHHIVNSIPFSGSMEDAVKYADIYIRMDQYTKFDSLLKKTKFKQGGEFLPFVLRKRFMQLSIEKQRLILHKAGNMGTDITDEGRVVRDFMVEDGVLAQKLGQMLSERGDMVGAEWVEHLRKLQDELDPVAWQEGSEKKKDENGVETSESVKECLSQETRHSVIQALQQKGFTIVEGAIPRVSGTGSIAQAYKVEVNWVGEGEVPKGLAQNANGTYTLVIKVRKPGVREEIIKNDGKPSAQMLEWRRLAEDIEAVKERFPGMMDAVGLYEEFFSILKEEIDFTNEAGNYATLQGIKGRDVTYPAVISAQEDILIMGFVKGKPIKDAYPDDPTMRAKLGDKIMERFLKDVASGKPVHGDWNPGNILVEEKVSGQSEAIHMIDPGVMFKLNSMQLNNIIRLILKLQTRDIEGAVEAAVKLHSNGEIKDKDKLKNKLRVGFENLLMEMAQGKREGTGSLQEAFKIMDTAGIVIGREYTRFLRAFVTVEGLARALNPNLNIKAILAREFRSIASPIILEGVSDLEGMAKAMAAFGKRIVMADSLKGASARFGDLEKRLKTESKDKPAAREATEEDYKPHEWEKIEIRQVISENPIIEGTEGIELLRYCLGATKRGRELLKAMDKNGWQIIVIDDAGLDPEMLMRGINMSNPEFRLITLKGGMYLKEAIAAFIMQAVGVDSPKDANSDISSAMQRQEVRAYTTLWRVEDEFQEMGAELNVNANNILPLAQLRKILVEEGEDALIKSFKEKLTETRNSRMTEKAEMIKGQLTPDEVELLKTLFLIMGGINIFSGSMLDIVQKLTQMANIEETFVSLATKLAAVDNIQGAHIVNAMTLAFSKLTSQVSEIMFNRASGNNNINLQNILNQAQQYFIHQHNRDHGKLNMAHFMAVARVFEISIMSSTPVQPFNIRETEFLPEDMDCFIQILQVARALEREDFPEKFGELQKISAGIHMKLFEKANPAMLVWWQLAKQNSQLFDEIVGVMNNQKSGEDAMGEVVAKIDSLLEPNTWATMRRSTLVLMEKLLFYTEAYYPNLKDNVEPVMKKLHDGKWDQVVAPCQVYRDFNSGIPNADNIGSGEIDITYLSDPRFNEDGLQVHNRVNEEMYRGKTILRKGVGIRSNGGREGKNPITTPNEKESLTLCYRKGDGDHFYLGGMHRDEAYNTLYILDNMRDMYSKRSAVGSFDSRYGVSSNILLKPLCAEKPSLIPISLQLRGEIENNLNVTFEYEGRSITVEDLYKGARNQIYSKRQLPDGRTEYLLRVRPDIAFKFTGLDSEENVAEDGVIDVNYSERFRVAAYQIESSLNRPMSNTRMWEMDSAVRSRDPFEIYKAFSPFCAYYGYRMKYKTGAGKYKGRSANLRSLLEHYFTIEKVSDSSTVQWETVLKEILTGFSARVGSMLDLVHNEMNGSLHSKDPETAYSQFSGHNYNFLTFFDPDVLVFDIKDKAKREQWVDRIEARKAIMCAAQMFGFSGRECEESGLSILNEYLIARSSPAPVIPAPETRVPNRETAAAV